VMPEVLVGGAVTATKNGRLMSTWSKVWDMPECIGLIYRFTDMLSFVY